MRAPVIGASFVLYLPLWRRLAPLIVAVVLPLWTRCAPATPSTATIPPDRAAPRPGPAELSRFSVPLAYDFSAMQRVVERVVPITFGSMDSVRMIGTDTHRHYAFEAHRGTFTTFADGRELHLRATVSYRARGYFKPPIGPTISAGCGDEQEQPRLTIELAAPVTLTEDWHLSSRARLVRIQPASTEARDRCDVSILHKDVTGQVVEAAQSAITEHLPDIDRRIGEVDLQDKFTEWWRLLARPIALTDGVWLVLGPERLRMGKVSGRDKVLSIPVTLDARPRVVTGAQPAPDTVPLPPLAHDTVANGFHILLDGDVDYGTASKALTEAFAHRTIVEGGKKIRIDSVNVLPAAKGQLALLLTLGGDAKGTLRFLGTPKYDGAHGELTVPDLDYDLSVDSRLINTYAWLRSDALRATFRQRARFPLGPVLAKGRALLLEGLNRKIGDAVRLSATVDSVAVTGLYVTLDRLVVRAEASGRARVAVTPK
jgi:hypothetical protein